MIKEKWMADSLRELYTVSKAGRPKEYEGEMLKKNLRLPKYIWDWLDGLSVNRTKAMIFIFNKMKKGVFK